MLQLHDIQIVGLIVSISRVCVCFQFEMHFRLFGSLFVFACLVQLYTSEENTALHAESAKFDQSDNGVEAKETIPAEDYEALQAFKYFVYPAKYSNSMLNNNTTTTITSRNITLDKINYQPLVETAITTTKENLIRIIDDPADYRQNYPNNYNNYDGYIQPQQQQQTFQPHLLNQGGSMVHLVDPLFLMATLAFVVFLINSILGLVNKLNLPILGTKRNQAFHEIVDAERDRMDDDALEDIERIIKNALFEFKKHLN